MRIQIFLLLFVGLLVLAGCPSGDDDDTAPANVEGDEAGECDDGVDNDQDGVTDCDDDGCVNATACTGDDDTGDDDTADDDTGDDDTGDDDTGDDDTTGACEDAVPCEGDYDIENSSDLDAAYLCESITGDLTISDVASIATFDLPCLGSVGGSLYVGSNASLTGLQGLPNLASVGIDLTVEYNPAFSALDGMGSLSTVGGNVTITENDVLTIIDLPTLAAVGIDIGIWSNASLVSLEMDSLLSVGGGLVITHHDFQTTLSMPSLVSAGSVGIGFCDSLTTFNMTSLSTVEDSLSVCYMETLADLDGWASVAIVGNNLGIQENLCLSQAEADAFAASIHLGGNAVIEDNGANYPCP